MFQSKIVPLLFCLTFSNICLGQFKIEITSSSNKIDFQKDEESRKNYQLLMNMMAKVEKILPPQLKNTINNNIHLEFTDKLTRGETSTGHAIAGMVKGKYNVALHPDILFSGTANGRNDLLYTVIHEIGHLYDNLNVHYGSDRNQVAKCQTQNSISMLGESNISNDCIAYRDTKTSISTTPAFLNLYGSHLESYDGSRSRVVSSKMTNRVQDRYKMVSPQEFFAVNFENYILDPEYKCKEPTAYKLISSAFSYHPYPNANCTVPLVYIDSSSQNIEKIRSKTAENTNLKEIDFSRVYQIHYFLAAKGAEAMSRWGHSMLRIVICAPGKALGPDCVKDLSHHLVLSFRGLVDTPEINSLDGLSGKYPSRLFLHSVNQVSSEYNRQEFRDVVSYPLNLNREQMKDVVVRAIETFWNYSGTYYFLSNNCAHETFNLLRTALNSPKLNNEVVSTPIGLLDLLVKHDLVDMSFLASERDIQKRDGYLFESELNYYSKAFELMKSINSESLKRMKSVQDYINSDFNFRKSYLKSTLELIAQNPDLQKSRETLINKFILIEEYILEKHKMTSARAIAKQLSDPKQVERNDNLKQISEITRQKIEVVVASANPGKMLDQSRYGIPKLSETKKSDAEISARVLKEVEMNENLLKLFDLVISEEDAVTNKGINDNLQFAKSQRAPLRPLQPRQ